jgi:hypothetical protein
MPKYSFCGGRTKIAMFVMMLKIINYRKVHDIATSIRNGRDRAVGVYLFHNTRNSHLKIKIGVAPQLLAEIAMAAIGRRDHGYPLRRLRRQMKSY